MSYIYVRIIAQISVIRARKIEHEGYWDYSSMLVIKNHKIFAISKDAFQKLKHLYSKRKNPFVSSSFNN